MSVAAVRRVVCRLAPDRPPTDAELVLAIAGAGREAAFEELVARYGSMVLGVCRRVLSDAHDAEDAFQAAFLVLARKANTIRPPGAVGGFLYGVAVRTARKAKTAAARRRRREMAAMNTANSDRKSVACGADVGGELDRAELRAVIDDELAALPDPQRAAVVLCDLHGKTRAEAAAELDRPEGTVAAWLARGRKALAARLARRGVALPAAGLVAVATPAAVSAELRSTAFAALLGRGASPTARALAESVMRSLSAGKKLVAALVAVGALLAAVATAGAWHGSEDPKPDAPPIPVRAPAPDEPKPNATPTAWKEARALALNGWLGGSVVFSADGKTLYVGGTSGHVRSYDTATMKQFWEAKAGEHFAALALAPDGATLAATVKDGVRFFDAATGKIGELLEEKGSAPHAVGWFPDRPVLDPNTRQLLATSRKVISGSGSGYVVKVWLEKSRLERGEPSTISAITVGAGKQPADEYAIPLAISPDGKWAVSRGPIDRDTGKNVLWAAGSDAGNQRLDGHKAEVVSAAWAKDGKQFVTGDADGVVILWEAATFKEKSRLKLGGRVAALAISADGKSVAAAAVPLAPAYGQGAYTEEVFVWPSASPPANPEPISRHQAGGHFKGFASVAFSPDGKTLVSTFANFAHLSRTGELIGRVRVFAPAAAGKPVPLEKPVPAPAAAPGRQWTDAAVLEDHGRLVNGVAISPDGTSFAAATDGNVTCWNAATRKKLWVYHPTSASPPLSALAYSPDGKHLCVATRLDVLRLDAKTGKEDHDPKEILISFGKMHALAYNPDGTRLAASDGYRTRVQFVTDARRDVTLGAPPKESEPAPVRPAGVAWSNDGKTLATIYPEKVKGKWTVALWGTGPGGPLEFLGDHTDPVTALAWSKDGKVIATGDEGGNVVLWNVATGKELWRRKFTGRDDTIGRINALGISPADGTIAAAVSLGSGKGAERIVLLAGKDGADVEHLMRGRYAFTSVAWGKDGKYLVSGSGALPGQGVEQKEPAVGEVVVWERKP